jgi:hypothetical protein
MVAPGLVDHPSMADDAKLGVWEGGHHLLALLADKGGDRAMSVFWDLDGSLGRGCHGEVEGDAQVYH